MQKTHSSSKFFFYNSCIRHNSNGFTAILKMCSYRTPTCGVQNFSKRRTSPLVSPGGRKVGFDHRYSTRHMCIISMGWHWFTTKIFTPPIYSTLEGLKCQLKWISQFTFKELSSITLQLWNLHSHCDHWSYFGFTDWFANFATKLHYDPPV